MILRFNDATELQVQSAGTVGTLLQIKTISATEEELEENLKTSLLVRKWKSLKESR